jgi:hypothetical protein
MTAERQSEAAAPDEESLFVCLLLPVNSQRLILERDCKRIATFSSRNNQS